MIDIATKSRIHNASDDVLKKMLRQAQEQSKVHRLAANNTHYTQDRREQSTLKAEQQQAIEAEIQAELQAKENAAIKAIVERPHQGPQHTTTGNAAHKELLKLEDDLMRAQYNEAEFRLKIAQCKTDSDRYRNHDLAEYWLKRAINATSRINEFIVKHKNDMEKPWLEDDQQRNADESLH